MKSVGIFENKKFMKHLLDYQITRKTIFTKKYILRPLSHIKSFMYQGITTLALRSSMRSTIKAKIHKLYTI
jgi:hypothetical protein